GIARTAGVSTSTAGKTLTALEASGLATRTPGTGAGRTRIPDTWTATPTPDNHTDNDTSQPESASDTGTETGGDSPTATDTTDMPALAAQPEPEAVTEATSPPETASPPATGTSETTETTSTTTTGANAHLPKGALRALVAEQLATHLDQDFTPS